MILSHTDPYRIMTTEEVEVTTESIETEKVTFCDSCGATEDVVSLVKNPKVGLVEYDEYGKRTHEYAHKDGKRRSVATDRSGEIHFEDDGAIDACEPCLLEQFNEDVVIPSVLEGIRETPKSDTTGEDSGDSSDWGPNILTSGYLAGLLGTLTYLVAPTLWVFAVWFVVFLALCAACDVLS